MPEPILSVRNLNVKFSLRGQTLHAIRDVSLDVMRGESLAIVGESGSGKSVFVKSFMGLNDKNGWIDSGEILYEGKNLAALKSEKEWGAIRGGEIAMVMQDPMTSLNPLMTIGAQILEAIELHQRLHGAEAKKAMLDILRDVGITDPEKRARQYPHEFSGGQRQRVGIARAMIMEPKLIIADEPISALDVSIRAQVLNLMNKFKEEKGLTYIFIAHDLSVVRYFADRIAVIHKGRIVEVAPTDVLFKYPLHPYTLSLLQAVPMPDPRIEKAKEVVIYDESKRDFSGEKPKLREIEPGHLVFMNDREKAEYEVKLAQMKKEAGEL